MMMPHMPMTSTSTASSGRIREAVAAGAVGQLLGAAAAVAAAVAAAAAAVVLGWDTGYSGENGNT